MTSVRAARRADTRAWLRLLWCLGIALAVLLLAPLALAAPHPAHGGRPPAAAPIAAGEVAGPQSVAAVTDWVPDAGPMAALPAARPAALPAQEQADKLLTEFSVDTDGSVVVTETITWRFPEGEERHGILRNVKVRVGYQDSDTQYRYYELTGVSVTSPSGAPTDISISDFGAFRQIRHRQPLADHLRHRRLRGALPAGPRGQRHRRRHGRVLLQRGRPLQRLPAAAGLGHGDRPGRRRPGRRASTATSAPRPRARRRPERPAPSPSPTSRRSRARACSPPTPATPSVT